MKSINTLKSCLLASTLLVAASSANATTWEWSFAHDEVSNCSDGNQGLCDAATLPGNFWYRLNAGTVDSLYLSFDDVDQTLSLTATIGAYAGGLANAIEIVLTDGPKPNFDGTDQREHTILYLDGFTSPGTVSAYQYNEVNLVPSASYTGELAARYDDAFSLSNNPDGSVTFSLVDLDMSALGGQIGFGEELGLWFHTLELDRLNYAGDGSISDISAARVGWVDVNTPVPTSPVPVPAGFWLLGSALLGLLRKRG